MAKNFRKKSDNCYNNHNNHNNNKINDNYNYY